MQGHLRQDAAARHVYVAFLAGRFVHGIETLMRSPLPDSFAEFLHTEELLATDEEAALFADTSIYAVMAWLGNKFPTPGSLTSVIDRGRTALDVVYASIETAAYEAYLGARNGLGFETDRFLCFEELPEAYRKQFRLFAEAAFDEYRKLMLPQAASVSPSGQRYPKIGRARF